MNRNVFLSLLAFDSQNCDRDANLVVHHDHGALDHARSHNYAQVPARNAASVASRPAETAASAAARSWPALLDGGQWEASWRAASSMFKSPLTSALRATTIQSVRQPPRRVSSRTLQSVVQTKMQPGAPKVDYQVLQFQSRFATKLDAVETTVLARENGSWRVSGYFIH